MRQAKQEWVRVGAGAGKGDGEDRERREDGSVPAGAPRGTAVLARGSLRIGAALLVALAGAPVAACSSEHATTASAAPADRPADVPGRGELLGATHLLTLPRSAATSVAAAIGRRDAFRPRHDVRMYAIRYRTVDTEGRATVATGAAYLPAGATEAVPLLSYQHGTTTEKQDVPSNPTNAEGQLVGLLFASGGGVVSMTDYLGLGGSPGMHPYHHAATEASAALDALRAAKALAVREGIALADELYLFGYSHGGHATMALHREIEERAASEFTVTASAPMSGAYDLYGTGLEVLRSGARNPTVSVYLAYMVPVLAEIYDLAPRLSDLMPPPYDSVALRASTSGMSSARMADLLAPVPRDNLRPEVVAGVLADREHPLARALRANDVYDWTPRAPVRLYFATADRSVPPSNSRTAQARMRERGADVRLIDLGRLSHGGAVVPALAGARIWFDSLSAAR